MNRVEIGHLEINHLYNTKPGIYFSQLQSCLKARLQGLKNKPGTLHPGSWERSLSCSGGCPLHTCYLIVDFVSFSLCSPWSEDPALLFMKEKMQATGFVFSDLPLPTLVYI